MHELQNVHKSISNIMMILVFNKLFIMQAKNKSSLMVNDLLNISNGSGLCPISIRAILIAPTN